MVVLRVVKNVYVIARRQTILAHTATQKLAVEMDTPSKNKIEAESTIPIKNRSKTIPITRETFGVRLFICLLVPPWLK